MQKFLSLSSLIILLSASAFASGLTPPEQLRFDMTVRYSGAAEFSEQVVLQRNELRSDKVKYSGYAVRNDGRRTAATASIRTRNGAAWMKLETDGYSVETAKYSLADFLTRDVAAQATEWHLEWDSFCGGPIDGGSSMGCHVPVITNRGPAVIRVLPSN